MGQLKRRNLSLTRNPDKILSDKDRQRVLEELRIVSNDTPESKIYFDYLQSYFKLLFPNADLEKHPIDFFVSDLPEFNAFLVPASNPPIIGFSKGFLEKAEYVEDICGALGHEGTHHRFSELYGKEHMNSKLEELSSDLWPLQLMVAAKPPFAPQGLDPRQYVNFAEKNIFNETKETFEQIVNVHPTYANRVRSLENGLAVLDKKVGGFARRRPTPLPVDFKEAVKKLKHISYLDKQLPPNFIMMVPHQALATVNQIFIKTTTLNKARVADFCNVIKKIKIKRSQFEDRKIQDEFANNILKLAEKVKITEQNLWASDPKTKKVIFTDIVVRNLYSALVASLSADLEIKPIGRLRAYEDAIVDFLEAEDSKGAVKAANSFLSILENEKVETLFLGSLVNWSNFTVPDLNYKKLSKVVPWNKHLHWAAKDRSEAIAKLLFILGVTDSRLYETISSELENNVNTGKLPIFYHSLAVEGIIAPEDYEDREFTVRVDLHAIEVNQDGRLVQPPKRATKKKFDIGDVEFLHKQLEAQFVKIVPGDTAEEEKFKEAAERLYGEEGLANFKGEDRSRPLIGVRNAEHNFPLFMEVNQNVLRDTNESHISVAIGTKFYEMAKSKDPQQIAYLRGIYLGFPPGDRLYSLTLSDLYLGNLRLPIYSDPSKLILFVMDNPGNIFSIEEQLIILDKTLDQSESGRDKSHNDIVEVNANKVRQFLGYQKPKSGAYFNKILTNLLNHKLHNKMTSFAKTMLIVELRTLILDRRTSGLDLSLIIKNLDVIDLQDHPDLKKFFRPKVREYTWPTDLETLVDQWLKVYYADIFPSDQVLCFRILKEILRSIVTKPLNLQIELYEKLLFTKVDTFLTARQHAEYRNRIKDPKVRTKLQKLWVNAIYKRFGKDRNKKTYQAEIKKILAKIKDGLNINDRIEITAQLADKLQTQEALTDLFRESLTKISKKELESTHDSGIILEAALIKLRNSDEGRREMIEFLIHPLTKGSIGKIHAALLDHAREELAFQRSDATKVYKYSATKVRAELKFTWENFWASPFEFRAAMFENLLFPDIKNAQKVQQVFDDVNDELFPETEPYSQEARIFTKAYFSVIPNYQYRILLSAMLVTAEKSKEAALSIGQRLALVLELLGPAETKLGQVIHSHPKTPPAIKDGMERLKGHAAPPFRWDLLDNYRQSVPAEIRAHVTHIGKLLGSASLFLALEAKTVDNNGVEYNGVFKILRPHALDRAQNGFEIMLQMLEALRSEFDPSTISIFEQMIHQAQKNCIVETDHQILKQQTELAVQLYNNRKVTVAGQEVSLYVPKVIHSGLTYQYVEKAPGKHFNELKEATPEELGFKQLIALAYFAFELALILRGGHFDSDRHGAQQRVENHNIYLFDWGGLSLAPPSGEELTQFGNLLFEIFFKVQAGEDLADAFTNAVQNRANAGENVEYLLNVQKALLALEDFRHFIDPATLQQLFVTLLRRVAHPNITNAIVNQAIIHGMEMEQLQALLEQQQPLEITIKRK